MTVNTTTSERQPVSAPTHRVVAVVEFLASDPSRRPSLAEIVRAVGMTRATAHAVLTQLCAERWVDRGEDNRFALAPAFLGRMAASARTRPLVATFGPSIRAAARDLAMPVILAEREDASITVADIAGDIAWAQTGMRIPIWAPLCREFIAWERSTERAQWLDTVPEAARDAVTDVIRTVGDRGFSVENLGREATEVMATLHSVHRADSAPAVQRRIADLLIDLMTSDYRPEDLSGTVPTMSVAVPVATPERIESDGSHRVTASLVACPGATVDARRIDHIVERLREAVTTTDGATTP
ncbi:helix-turn-helix domain-containing protein [Williamsia herbipolensis]|uniref:helix-turn-helix domain-containing protein n=1 Tax=Williamsia herbipolensis TaxID=1603258 RepID=UPI0009E585DC|nr:helix-turn-helix domain-containing protein [Williamsia herbipolensis]